MGARLRRRKAGTGTAARLPRRGEGRARQAGRDVGAVESRVAFHAGAAGANDVASAVVAGGPDRADRGVEPVASTELTSAGRGSACAGRSAATGELTVQIANASDGRYGGQIAKLPLGRVDHRAVLDTRLAASTTVRLNRAFVIDRASTARWLRPVVAVAAFSIPLRLFSAPPIPHAPRGTR
jgi:hypothetical protein